MGPGSGVGSGLGMRVRVALGLGCSLSAPAGPTQLTISRAAGLVGGPRVYMCAKSSCAASVKRGG